MVDEALDLALFQAVHAVEANAGEGRVEFFFILHMAQFHCGGHRAEGQLSSKALINLAGMQAAGDVAWQAQLAACGGNIQQ
ncbi:hypothetical protein FQZ97_1270680 [compost metagenome]